MFALLAGKVAPLALVFPHGMTLVLAALSQRHGSVLALHTAPPKHSTMKTGAELYT